MRNILKWRMLQMMTFSKSLISGRNQMMLIVEAIDRAGARTCGQGLRAADLTTHCLIPAPGPVSFHVSLVQLSCRSLCAGTSSRPTGDQPTSRTSSAQSHIRRRGKESWLWDEKDAFRLWSLIVNVCCDNKYNWLRGFIEHSEWFYHMSNLNLYSPQLIIILLWDLML